MPCALCPVCRHGWQHAQPKKEHAICANCISWTWFPAGAHVWCFFFFFFTTSSVRSVRGRPDTIVSLCHRVFFFFPRHFCVLFLDTRGASRQPLPVNDVGLTTASHALLAVVVLEAMSHREVEPWHSWNCYPQPEAQSPLWSTCSSLVIIFLVQLPGRSWDYWPLNV